MSGRPGKPGEDLRTTVTALGATFIGDASSRGAVFVVSVLAARALDPSQFAFYLLLLAVCVLAAGLWDAGVSTILVRSLTDDRTDIGRTLRGAFRLRALTFPLWLAAAGIGFISVGAFSTGSPGLVLLFATTSLLAGTSIVLLATLRGRLRFGSAAVAQSTGRWTTAGLVAAATVASEPSALLPLIAAAHAVGEAVTLGSAWFGVSRLDRTAGGRDGHLTLTAALPYAANGLLNLAYNRLDVVLVAYLTSASELARYAPASRIQDALYLVSGTTFVVAVPLLSRLIASGGSTAQVWARLRSIWLLGGGLAIAGATGVFVFADDIIRVVLGESYLASSDAVRIIAWSMPLSVVGAPLLAVLVAHGRGADTTRAFVAAFVTSLSLHVALDWWLGATGAAIASVARDAANAIVAAYLVARLLRTDRSPPQPGAPGRAEGPVNADRMEAE